MGYTILINRSPYIHVDLKKKKGYRKGGNILLREIASKQIGEERQDYHHLQPLVYNDLDRDQQWCQNHGNSIILSSQVSPHGLVNS